jgi:hypothetical protein
MEESTEEPPEPLLVPGWDILEEEDEDASKWLDGDSWSVALSRIDSRWKKCTLARHSSFCKNLRFDPSHLQNSKIRNKSVE